MARGPSSLQKTRKVQKVCNILAYHFCVPMWSNFYALYNAIIKLRWKGYLQILNEILAVFQLRDGRHRICKRIFTFCIRIRIRKIIDIYVYIYTHTHTLTLTHKHTHNIQRGRWAWADLGAMIWRYVICYMFVICICDMHNPQPASHMPNAASHAMDIMGTWESNCALQKHNAVSAVPYYRLCAAVLLLHSICSTRWPMPPSTI